MSADEQPQHSHETGGAWSVTQWQVPGCPACASKCAGCGEWQPPVHVEYPLRRRKTQSQVEGSDPSEWVREYDEWRSERQWEERNMSPCPTQVVNTPRSLKDFLLARIEEDEEAAREWYGLGTVDERRDDFWLAELRAKRQIIAGPFPHFAIQVMAAVYDDHPDYREEWRP